jgi:phenylpyruvate tautomerase PptA (4-oxalocrotonate tautomerase family)
MPIYQCVTAGIDLTEDQRDRIAHGITTIHHEETQAPEPFIRVAFTPLPQGLMYTAGKVESSVVISGGIRYGRSEVTRRNLLRRLHQLVVDVVGLPVDQIVVVASDVPNGWILEAGLPMPEPTPEAEAAWAAELEKLLPERFAVSAGR